MIGLGIVIGLMLSCWSVYMLVHHYRIPRKIRKERGKQVWPFYLFLLIGLADLLKCIRDLTVYLQQ